MVPSNCPGSRMFRPPQLLRQSKKSVKQMSVWQAMVWRLLGPRGALFPMPANCAVSLTLPTAARTRWACRSSAARPAACHRLHARGGPAPVGGRRCRRAGHGGRVRAVRSLAPPPAGLKGPPDAQDAKVLVLRGFAERLGPDATRQIEHELEQQKLEGKIDSQALMRGW